MINYHVLKICCLIKEVISNNWYLSYIHYLIIDLPKFKKPEDFLDNTVRKWIYLIKETGNLYNIEKVMILRYIYEHKTVCVSAKLLKKNHLHYEIGK